MPSDKSNHPEGDHVLQVAGHGLLRPSVRVDGKGISKPTYLDELIFYSLLHYASLPASPPVLRPIGDLLQYVPSVRDMWFVAPTPSPSDVSGGGGGSPRDVDNLLQVFIGVGNGIIVNGGGVDEDANAELLVARYFDAARLAACKAANILPTSPAALKDGCWYIDMLNEVGDMEAPCVIDIKVGKLRSSLSAGASGVRKEAKDIGTTSKSIGLRLSGVKHMAAVGSSLVETTVGMDKAFGRVLTDTTFATMLQVFCTTSLGTTTLTPSSTNDDPSGSSPPLCLFKDLTTMGIVIAREEKDSGSSRAYIGGVCAARLRGLVSTLRSHPSIMASLCMISSSVMIAYDCIQIKKSSDVSSTSTSSTHTPAVVVKLIDFARSGPRREHYPEVGGVDYVNSLERLANLLDKV